MFDFFRDALLEAGGIDSTAAKRERSEKQIQKKQENAEGDKHIFSKGIKRLAFVFGIFYLVMAGSGVVAMKELGELNAFEVIRFILLSACDVACLVCLAIGKKKTEIAAIVLMVVFFFAQYFTALLL